MRRPTGGNSMSELELSASDLHQAQRFNAFLNRLPRFHTGRRWLPD